MKEDVDEFQLVVREAITRAIPEAWLDPKKHPRELAAVMVVLIDASVSIAIQVFGKEAGVEKISQLVNSTLRRIKK